MKNKKTLSFLLCGCMLCMPFATGIVSAEETARTTYDATFEAVGSDAETYNENMTGFIEYYLNHYAETNELNKVSGYDEPVSFTTAGWYTSTMQDAFAGFEQLYGETITQTRWLDVYKQLFNAEGETAWTILDGEYNQKLRLEMAAGTLPDIFIVRDQNDLIQMAEAGMIWDMTDVIEEYATEEMKEIWQSDGGIALAQATVGDRIYGAPAKQSDTDTFSYLWIRKDWLDQVGMEYPTTFEELEAIMEAFVKADFDGNGQDDTVGILLDKDLYYSIRGLFSGFSAYPEYWVEGENGLEWGGVSEANKAALSCLADWYQKGYISPEFITQDNTAARENMLAGKCGILYGGHWLGHNFGDLHELDETSDWVAVPLPSATGEAVNSPLKASAYGWVVVNSEFEHPEIALKMQSVMRAAFSAPQGAWMIFEQNVAWNASPVRNIVSAFDNLFTYQNLMEAYETGDESVLEGKAPTYWVNLHGDLQWEWELMFGPDEDTPMSVLETAYEEDRLFYDAFYGEQSTYMQDRWTTIKDEQLIAFTKMIVGDVSVEDGFSQWVDTFNSLGGEQITQEVNEWYSSK